MDQMRKPEQAKWRERLVSLGKLAAVATCLLGLYFAANPILTAGGQVIGAVYTAAGLPLYAVGCEGEVPGRAFEHAVGVDVDVAAYKRFLTTGYCTARPIDPDGAMPSGNAENGYLERTFGQGVASGIDGSVPIYLSTLAANGMIRAWVLVAYIVASLILVGFIVGGVMASMLDAKRR